MIYELFVTNEDVPERIGDFLARFFGVPRDRVFVDDEDEQDGWDWDALRTSLACCQYRRLPGNLACILSIGARYERERLDPPEQELAERVARELGTVVLFSEGTEIPSVENLVTPDGRFLLARFNEAVDGVAEVSSPLSELPGAVVANFEDEVRSRSIAHPVADRFFPQQGEFERWGTIRSRLIMWERLTGRMATNWPPTGWYGASMYASDLESRDQAATLIPQLDPADSTAAQNALDLLDATYRGLTVDDAGAALVDAGVVTAGEIAGRPWYWHRRPSVLPWEDSEAKAAQ